MLRADPIEEVSEFTNAHLPPMEQTVEGPLSEPRAGSTQIQQRSGPIRDRYPSEHSEISIFESAGPPDLDVGTGGGALPTHQNFHVGRLDLPETPEVGGTPVRGDTSDRQARGTHVLFEASRRTSDSKDSGIQLPHRPSCHFAPEGTWRETRLLPLRRRKQSVLPRRQVENRFHDKQSSKRFIPWATEFSKGRAQDDRKVAVWRPIFRRAVASRRG